ncbi:hypothetical protein [Streptomyces sp. 4R-3d]|uniref:hypothetical protein n=1 Tax=Streptomyces sp. 4R-3d TaxID=2559605 RepID=UPI001071EEA1|nr:hypothetical protein [Streptomyces sp. 4R-3d]TFI27146.1 hypothetical protein E4P36_13510 [Streptomyces sp. 4R-3d]
MKIVGRAFAAAGAAVALVVGLPLNAQAATGTFMFHTQPGGVPQILNNPADGQCYTLRGANGAVQNSTNRAAELYSGRRCSGDPILTLEPDQAEEQAEFTAVRFVR